MIRVWCVGSPPPPYAPADFDEAQVEFEALRAADPYRLEQLDTYSNILYVKECKAELSYLAHSAVKNDKYRPETCCIIGGWCCVDIASHLFGV